MSWKEVVTSRLHRKLLKSTYEYLLCYLYYDLRLTPTRNPPEDQGIREEWKTHAGWHRKEDLYLRRRSNNNQPNLVQQNGDVNDGPSLIDGNGNKNDNKISRGPWGVFGMISIIICCAYVIFVFSKRRGGRDRKKMKDVV